MGQEARCTVRAGKKVHEGTALLETKELIFRSPELRIVIPFTDIRSVAAEDGRLRVEHAGGVSVLELGAAAAKWAERIKNPRSRIDKLGIAAGARVALVGGSDEALVAELSARGAEISRGKDLDVIFLFAGARKQLEQLVPLQAKLKKNGAIWVIRPKGVAEISEADVMNAGKSSGLVDTKVVAFSATHTAEKLVIPVSRR